MYPLLCHGAERVRYKPPAVAGGVVTAPNAAVQLPQPVPIVFGLVILALAAAALVAIRHPFLAVVFGVIVVINAALMLVWRQ